MASLLVGNGAVLTMGPSPKIIESGAVLIDKATGLISNVGDSTTLRKENPTAEFFDAQGKLIMPGLICAHTHFYGMFSRGMALKDEPPRNFLEILQRLWWRLDKALQKEDVYLSAAVGVLSAIRAGCTTLIDHHASPNFIDGSLDEIARATLAGGIRANLCYEVTDRNGHPEALAGIKENMRFIRRCAMDPNPLLSATFGLHASFTVTDKTLEETARVLRRESPHPQCPSVHIHVAEASFDQEHATNEWQLSPIQRLHKFGLLGPRSMCGHCVHVSPADMALLRQTDTIVVHNPSSNMNNGVGLPDVTALLAQGVCVGLGTDGISHDMLGEFKTCYLAHKLLHRDPQRMGGDSVARILFDNNAQLASRLFELPIGVLAPGAAGDLIIVDYHCPTKLTTGNFPWHVMFGMSGADVCTTICAGKILMRDRVLNPAVVGLDEGQVHQRARELCPLVWERV